VLFIYGETFFFLTKKTLETINIDVNPRNVIYINVFERTLWVRARVYLRYFSRHGYFPHLLYVLVARFQRENPGEIRVLFKHYTFVRYVPFVISEKASPPSGAIFKRNIPSPIVPPVMTGHNFRLLRRTLRYRKCYGGINGEDGVFNDGGCSANWHVRRRRSS